MNLVLFEASEIGQPLARSDRRAVHVLTVLRREVGDSFDAGIVDGPRGKATLVAVDGAALSLRFEWGEAPPPLDPVTLVVGLPRPQTARKVLQEATALGVAAIHLVATERGERGYGRSRLWSTGEWRRHLIAGAEQSFSTRLPAVRHDLTLAEALASLPAGACRLALDNYEASVPLSSAAIATPLVLAIGSERGWSAAERGLLRASGFSLVYLGERVLRTETACVAALAIVEARLGLI